ncbi:hypothetical protein GF312_05445 [Candidatus Poribacteria bacterium]|nr:hypothetical protein [Candidatus Poribacteria bacterium]
MKFLVSIILASMLMLFAGVVYAVNLDDFNGQNLDDMWTVRDPSNKAEYRLEEGKLIVDLEAGADMYIQGTDNGVCFLMDPPDMEDFTLEMKVNVAVDGTQPPACQVGPLLFNEGAWAYSAWGPYSAGQDIRLEDCIAADYRWRDQTNIGINPGDVEIDQDVWLRIVKTGEELEFFAKSDANADWVSGGVDTKLGPNYTPGNYQVGIVLKSWGGSVDSTFEIDYFNIPEIAPVESNGKLATTWSAIK